VVTLQERETAAAGEDRQRRVLIIVLVVALAAGLFAAGAGTAVVAGIGADRPPGTDSADAGFARDMAIHHTQATEMAQVARDNSTDPDVRLIAYDIETQQFGQIGQMRGWLQSWDLSPDGGPAPMSWMEGGHAMAPGELMPGMATTAELDKLRTLSGKALDVYFLQLMIRHHRGALDMAQDGATHASEPYVRDLAGKMAQLQAAEIVTMEQMLRARGGQPLA
jgi:uncharacterized protein (DUF305 family)